MRKRPKNEPQPGPEPLPSAPSEQQAAAVLHHINIAFIRTDKTLKILYANPHAMELWDEKLGSPVGKVLLEHFPPLLDEEGRDALEDLLPAGRRATYTYYRQPGRLLMLHPLPDGYIISYLDAGQTAAHKDKSTNSHKVQSLERELKMLKKNRQQEIFRIIADTQEQERRRIAENLHVEIGQLLSAIKMQLNHISSVEAEKMMGEAIRKVRDISFELMPSLLKDFGLESALKDMIDKKLMAAGIQCKLYFRVPPGRLNDEINLVIFRIVQELINNIVRHAGAGEVSISVTLSAKKILLSVKDNGRGADPDSIRYGFGLPGIQNRVQLMQGEVRIATDEAGFSVTIRIPLISADQPVHKGIPD